MLYRSPRRHRWSQGQATSRPGDDGTKVEAIEVDAIESSLTVADSLHPTIPHSAQVIVKQVSLVHLLQVADSVRPMPHSTCAVVRQVIIVTSLSVTLACIYPTADPRPLQKPPSSHAERANQRSDPRPTETSSGHFQSRRAKKSDS